MNVEELNEDRLEQLATEYPNMTLQFWKGDFKGQLRAVYRARGDRPEKTSDFIRAINDGVIEVPEVTPIQRDKLIQIGVPVDNLKIKVRQITINPSPEKVKQVKEILRLYYEEELSLTQVARKIGVQQNNGIRKIVMGKSWVALTRPIIEEYRKQGRVFRSRTRTATQTAKEQTS